MPEEKNLPPAFPGITGTFKQQGRELEAARFLYSDATLRAVLYCLAGHPLTQAAEPGNGVVCRAAGCPVEGVVYVPEWPTVRLVAVQDREGA